MKMTVHLFIFCVLALALANPDDPVRNDKYDQKIKTYKLNVPGKEPITILEDPSDIKAANERWEDISLNPKTDKRDAEIKNLMTHIVHDFDGSRPRCFGPSCQDGYNEEEDTFDDYELTADKLKDYRDFPKDRLQAISALAAKLKKDKFKVDQFSSSNDAEEEDGNNGKVYTTWNRLKVKNHKHPYDDKDGWVTLEPVAWSSSKISKWKPNIKKQKPNHWNGDEDKFPSDERFPSDHDRFPSEQDKFPSNQDRFPSNQDRFPSNQDRFSSVSDSGNSYTYQQKRPSMRPGFINNKIHLPQEYETEIPSKPSWNKPLQAVYPSASSWALDEGRRPHRPNCDHQESYSDEDSYYGMSESLVTDHRPPNFPHEYEALHQSTSSSQKRPYRRPTQVVYAPQEYESDHNARPPYGDGQWVLLSTTKGYRNKKRQRSLNPASNADDRADVSTMTSHQAVALTVLPVDKSHTNMTTSHGGLLEVEKSFQTVEESKRDMDKKNDLDVAATQFKPVNTKNKVMKRRIVSNVSPDSSTLLAAVGAGMVPATMAMVVPMMLGRRRRRAINRTEENAHLNHLLYQYQR